MWHGGSLVRMLTCSCADALVPDELRTALEETPKPFTRRDAQPKRAYRIWGAEDRKSKGDDLESVTGSPYVFPEYNDDGTIYVPPPPAQRRTSQRPSWSPAPAVEAQPIDLLRNTTREERREVDATIRAHREARRSMELFEQQEKERKRLKRQLRLTERCGGEIVVWRH